MNDLAFVTALYYHTPHSRIGGRGWGMEHWAAPARNLIALDIPLIVYTHEHERVKLESFFQRFGYEKYEIIVEDLETFSRSDKIFELKENNGIINSTELANTKFYNQNNRNHHLCLQKINWLNLHAQQRTFDAANYCWIDFGLFHHGLFPDSLGGAEKLQRIRDEDFWPMNQISMFQPKLAEGIINSIEPGKLLCIQHTNEPVNMNLLKVMGVEERNNKGYIIGGLFGGDQEIIALMHDNFNRLVNIAFDNGMLVLEEPLLSVLYSTYHDKCTPFKFENWYHDCPGGEGVDRCCYGIDSSVYSFYKIFYKDFLRHE